MWHVSKTSGILVTTCNGSYTCSSSSGSQGGRQRDASYFLDSSGKYVSFSSRNVVRYTLHISTTTTVNQHLQTAFQNGVDQSNVIGTIVKDPITGAISVSMPSTTNNNLRGGLVQTNNNNMRFKSSQSSYLPSAPYTGVASVSPQFYQAGVSFAPGNLASLQSTMPPAPNVQALLNPGKR